MSLTTWLALAAYLAASAIAIRLGLAARPRSQHWLDHLGELRGRIVHAGLAWLLATILFFTFHADDGIRISVHASLAAQAFTAMQHNLLPDTVQLIVVRPIDGFLAQLTLAVGLAGVTTAPIWVSQLAGFITPALRKQERRAIRNAVAPVAALFVAGAAFAFLFVIPFLLRALYGYGTALNAQPLLQVSEFVGFVVGLMMVMGIAFQTPIVMYALTSAGLVEPQTWRKGWRIAVLVILVASAMVTDPTIVSQLMVAGPLFILYGLGILLTIKPTSR